MGSTTHLSGKAPRLGDEEVVVTPQLWAAEGSAGGRKDTCLCSPVPDPQTPLSPLRHPFRAPGQRGVLNARDAQAPDTADSKVLYVRIPATLERELEAVARRDHNNVSATARRLLSVGLRSEQQEIERRG